MTINIAISFLVSLIFISCNDTSSKNDVKAAIEESFETQPDPSGEVQIGQCFEEQFGTVPETITRKLDIIIVPDTSGSIRQE